MNIGSNIDISKIIKYIMIAVAVLFIAILNYCSISEHMSSNNRKITTYKIPEDYKERTRPSVSASLFYPAIKHQDEKSKKHPELMIVPHAGYQYSTAVAAKAYQALTPYSQDIKTVIFVVPQHQKKQEGAFVYPYEKIKISGKEYKINESINKILLTDKNFRTSVKAFEKEEIMSEQIPLLQAVIKDFLIVPIVYGKMNTQGLAKALETFASLPDTIIIISADLANYYAELQNPLSKNEEEHQNCGKTGIEAALEIAQNVNLIPEMLDLVNAQDIVAQLKKYDEELKADDERLEKERQSLQEFHSIYGKELLKIAKISLEEHILHESKYYPSRKDYSDRIFDKGVSVVKLEREGKTIAQSGTIIAQHSIGRDVAKNTYLSVQQVEEKDIQAEELNKIKIRIILLTDYERVRYKNEEDLLNKLDSSQDGVVLRSGDRQARFLPEEWKKYKSKQEFLNALKFKAGLSPSYWSNRIKIYKFYIEEIVEDEH